MTQSKTERVARAICNACNIDPDSKGEGPNSEYRWQEFIDVAVNAIGYTQGSISLPRNDDLRLELSRLNTLLTDIDLDDNRYREVCELLAITNDRIEVIKSR